MYQISEFGSERRNQNTYKIKYSKYSKHNNKIQTVVRLYFRSVCLNHPINNLNVKLYDVIHGNDINTYGMAVMENFSPINVVMITNRKT